MNEVIAAIILKQEGREPSESPMPWSQGHGPPSRGHGVQHITSEGKRCAGRLARWLASCWLVGCRAAWLPGHLAAWLPGCLAAWLLGCLAAWARAEPTLLRCRSTQSLAAWLPGCLVAWLAA